MKLLDVLDFDCMKMELLGTFGVVYMGGWAYITYFLDGQDFISVALTHFFSYALFMWVSYPISGSVLNPGLTAILMLFKRMETAKGVSYLIAQLIGSLLAASVLKLLSPEANMTKISSAGNMLGYPKSQLNFLYTGICECLSTFLVTLGYYMMIMLSDKTLAQVAGVSVSAVYFLNILMFGNLTGGASNIARVFGPALISKDYLNLLFITLGSIGGAFLAALLCEVVIVKDMKDKILDEEEEAAKGIDLEKYNNDETDQRDLSAEYDPDRKDSMQL